MKFADDFDMAYTTKYHLLQILQLTKRRHRLKHITLLFNVLTRTETDVEKRLKIDLKNIKSAYHYKKIDTYHLCAPNLILRMA